MEKKIFRWSVYAVTQTDAILRTKCLKNSLNLRKYLGTEPLTTRAGATVYCMLGFWSHTVQYIWGPETRHIPLHLLQPWQCQGLFEKIQIIFVTVWSDHRVITVIEQQRQVVLGSTALFTKVGQLHIDMRVGIFSDLYRQNKGKGPRAFGRIRTYNLQYGPVNLEKKKTT